MRVIEFTPDEVSTLLGALEEAVDNWGEDEELRPDSIKAINLYNKVARYDGPSKLIDS